MKKILLILIFSGLSFSAFSQNHPTLNRIASDLLQHTSYQASCWYTFSLPYGDTISSGFEITLKTIPEDTLCGIYYSFITDPDSRSELVTDFILFFDDRFYSAYQGEVTITSLSEEPHRFTGFETETGYILPIQKSPALYYFTPAEISRQIIQYMNDSSVSITQLSDTIINTDTCLRFVFESAIDRTEGDGKEYDLSDRDHVRHVMCFNRSAFYPVLISRETLSPVFNQIQIVTYGNTRIDPELPSDYFTEKNLLPSEQKDQQTISPLKHSEAEAISNPQAPDWVLPVWGADTSFSGAELRGKRILLEFTATWCVHCREAAKMMSRLAERYQNDSTLVLLSVYSSPQDNKETIERFVSQVEPGPVILYDARETEEDFGSSGYPNFFVISSEGKIISHFEGYGPGTEQQIINLLEQ